MDRASAISILKKAAAHDAAIFARRIDIAWASPIVEMIRDFHKEGFQAVLFGGCIRSMVLSRISTGKPGRPRDIDIVIQGQSIDRVRSHFKKFITRENRFGGLQMQRSNWHFDVWPIEKTNALVEDKVTNPSFSSLPFTTFLNLEAVAVDLWAPLGRERRVYSGNDQFFNGILSKTIEINRESNPYPLLCVIRSLIFAAQTDYSIGNKLARYIASHGSNASEHEISAIQEKHYGYIRKNPKTMLEWVGFLVDAIQKDPSTSPRLPIPRQEHLFSDMAFNSRLSQLQKLVDRRHTSALPAH